MSTDIKKESHIEQRTKKKLSRTLILSAAILFSLTSFVLAPIYTYVCSDIVFAVTVIPEIIDVLISILDIMAYAVCFSTIIYSFFKFSPKESVHLCVTYCAAVFLKYTANIIVTLISNGTIESADIIYVLIYFVLDLLLFTLVALFSGSFVKKYYKKKSITDKANSRLGIETSTKREEIFNSGKIFSKQNPLQCSALASAVILSAARIFSRLRFDIYVGAPQSFTDGMWMAVYYLSDILIIPIVYALSWLIFSNFDSKEQQYNLK